MSDLLSQKPNALVEHPDGGFSFGTIPDMPKFGLPGGEVYLRVGEHKGPNKGFGVLHIWEAHNADLDRAGCCSVEGVATFISQLVTPGAQIYCEFREMRGNHRIAVIRSQFGTLILEPRDERRGFGYYVVTWYPKRVGGGTLVGAIQRPPKT